MTTLCQQGTRTSAAAVREPRGDRPRPLQPAAGDTITGHPKPSVTDQSESDSAIQARVGPRRLILRRKALG
jgi:hypothetical protein